MRSRGQERRWRAKRTQVTEGLSPTEELGATLEAVGRIEGFDAQG